MINIILGLNDNYWAIYNNMIFNLIEYYFGLIETTME